MTCAVLHRTDSENPGLLSLCLSVQGFYIKKPFDYNTKIWKNPLKHENLSFLHLLFKIIIKRCASNKTQAISRILFEELLRKGLKNKRP